LRENNGHGVDVEPPQPHSVAALSSADVELGP
jgi:hypothetical protein